MFHLAHLALSSPIPSRSETLKVTPNLRQPEPRNEVPFWFRSNQCVIFGDEKLYWNLVCPNKKTNKNKTNKQTNKQNTTKQNTTKQNKTKQARWQCFSASFPPWYWKLHWKQHCFGQQNTNALARSVESPRYESPYVGNGHPTFNYRNPFKYIKNPVLRTNWIIWK